MAQQIFYSSFDYQTKTLTANWTIKNYTSHKNGPYINSQTFASPLYPEYKWKLSFLCSESFFHVYIKKQSELNTIKVNYNYSVSNYDTKAVLGNAGNIYDFSSVQPKCNGCTYSLARQPVTNINYQVSIKYLNGYVGFNQLNMPPIKAYQLYYNHLFDSNLYSDFTLIIGTQKLRVHKKIIASKCEYFQALIDSNMKETQDNKLIVDDFNYETVWHFISFLYTGIIAVYKVPLALDLYKLAHKYNEIQLQNMCRDFIVDWIKAPELISVLVAGHYYEESKFFEVAMKLFKENRGKDLEDFEHFDLISEYSQSFDLFKEIIANLNDATV